MSDNWKSLGELAQRMVERNSPKYRDQWKAWMQIPLAYRPDWDVFKNRDVVVK